MNNTSVGTTACKHNSRLHLDPHDGVTDPNPYEWWLE